MFASKNNRILFLHNPKCAGNAIGLNLIRMGFYKVEGRGTPEEEGASAQHRWNVPSKFRNCFIFTSVRHPLDRVVSFWSYMTQSMHWTYPDLKSLIHDGALSQLPPQHLYVEHSDYYVRFESLRDDLSKLDFMKPRLDLDLVNPSSHSPWQEHFSDREVYETCLQRYQKDCDTLGYDTTL